MQVVFFGARYIMAGSDGLIAHSTNGISWFKQTAGEALSIQAMVSGADQLIAMGLPREDDSTRALWSTNGIGWNPAEGLFFGGFTAATFGANQFVGVGWDGITAASANGRTWRYTSSATTNDLFAVTHSPLGFVAVGRGEILRARDGERWEKLCSMPDVLYDVAYGNGTFVIAGSPMWTHAMSSTNLVDWISHRGLSPGSVTFGNGRFVLSDHGTRGLLISTNGFDWYPGPKLLGGDIIFSDGFFCIAGSKGHYASQDGLTWFPIPSPPVYARVGRHMGRFFGWEGGYGTILELETFASLTLTPRNKAFEIQSLHTGRRFPSLQTSTDLSNWTDVPSLEPVKVEILNDKSPSRFFRLQLSPE